MNEYVETRTDSKVGSWTFDFGKKLFFATQETYLILGRTPEAFDGTLSNVIEFLLEEDRNAFLKGMEAAYKGVPLDIKFRISTEKGDIKFIHARAEMFYHADHSPDVMIGTVHDISEQLKLEKNIKELHGSFKFDSFDMHSGQFYYNHSTKKIVVGEEVYRLFDISEKEFDGYAESIFKIIHPEDQAQFAEVFSKNNKKGMFDITFRVINRQSEVRYVHSEGIVHFEKDEMQYISGKLEDVTKMIYLKKEAEQKLLEIENTQKSFLVGSWELDFETMHFNWSDVTYQIYGMNPVDGPPNFETFFSKIAPQDQPLVLDILNNVPKVSPFEIEFRIIRSEGNIRHIKHLVEVILDNEGNPKTIRGNIQDITDQKEMEVKIQRSLEEVSHLRKWFNLMVDHSIDVFEIIDQSGKIKYISPAVENMMGLTRHEIEGRFIWDFVEGEEKNALKTLVKTCIDEPHKVQAGTVQSKKKNGDTIYLEVTMSNYLNDSEVMGIVLNWKDITTKVVLDDRVHHLANYDELTGLPNRSYFKTI